MKKFILFALAFFAYFISEAQTSTTPKETPRQKTTFQTAQEWKPVTDVRADIAIVYGVGGNPSEKRKGKVFEERVKSLQEHGYVTHFMTGIAWGEYQDYFTGGWDCKTHLDEGQVQQNWDTIWHGHMVPYIVPTDNYLNYIMQRHIKRVIDAGVTSIYLEEPEFWARGGYSTAFKEEWKKYYGFDWRPQDASPENTYLSSKLKYHLYYNALNKVFTFAKTYGKSKGLDVKFYVPTHSLVIYSQWQIVSPEASLASLPCIDGYIAQVWTGTAREPNFYNGIEKERVFENAFLEYGSMESMTAPTGRKMYFLTDPIEDWARDWSDYKKNYQATFTAQLLYPNINNYEVMPWPDRIYEGLYSVSKGSAEKAHIPRFYSTQMQVMINALNDMPLSTNRLNGTKGISVLMSNSLMFQRFPTHEGYEDPQLSNFYGQALPFLKRGIPVSIVHMENLQYAKTLADTRVLLMSYSNMKPLDSSAHRYIADWVKNGGIVVYSGTDQDPYQSVQEWWNLGSYHFKAPSEHLFHLMGIDDGATSGGLYNYGKGVVYIVREDPKNYVMQKNGESALLEKIQDAFNSKIKKDKLAFKNYFYLKRGHYNMYAVLDESVDAQPYITKGMFVDLFDPQLPIVTEKIIQPGNQAFLFDINDIKERKKPQVLASASRVYNEVVRHNKYSFLAKSPLNTTNVMRILLPARPTNCIMKDVEVSNATNGSWNWDEKSKTCFVTFDNMPTGIKVELDW